MEKESLKKITGGLVIFLISLVSLLGIGRKETEPDHGEELDDFEYPLGI